MIRNYFTTILFLFSLLNNTMYSSVLISVDEQDVIDYKCDFEDRRLAESVRFVRSPVSCRVFHICAFFSQYTLMCPFGLYFDEDLDTCNFESAVNCSDSSSDFLKESTTTTTQITSFESTLANIITNSPVELQLLLNNTYNNLNETNISITSDSNLFNTTTAQSNLLNVLTSNVNDAIFISNQNSTSKIPNASVVSVSTTTVGENFYKGLNLNF